MTTSPLTVDLSAVDPNVSTNNAPSKLKTYAFAIAIIVGLGGIGVGIAELVGFLHVGGLYNLAQVNAIIMMAAGGGGGIVFLVIGIVGTVKNCRNPRSLGESNVSPSKAAEPSSTKNEKKTLSLHTSDGLVYEADAYKALDMEVVEPIPEPPLVGWDENDSYFKEPFKKNYILLYFAKNMRVKGEKTVRKFNLEAMRGVGKSLLHFPNIHDFTNMDVPISPGWKLVSKTVIPNSRNQSFEIQQKMVEAQRGFRIPHAVEAIFLNLAVYKTRNERLYGQDTETRCSDMIGQGSEQHPALVGHFRQEHFTVHQFHNIDDPEIGVAVIKDL